MSAPLTAREQQIMDLVYLLGEATMARLQQRLPSRCGYASIRSTLRALEQKEYVRRERHGRSYVYTAALPQDEARLAALENFIAVYFLGSLDRAFAALLDIARDEPEAVEAFDALLARARPKVERVEPPDDRENELSA